MYPPIVANFLGSLIVKTKILHAVNYYQKSYTKILHKNSPYMVLSCKNIIRSLISYKIHVAIICYVLDKATAVL